MESGSAAMTARFIHEHPLATLILISVVIRAVLMPLLTYDYDIYHWGLIIENIQSGNGLYETAGYYYTPVWGYFLGSMSAFMDTFLSIDVFGSHFTELIPVENLCYRFHIATITTIEFNVFIKSFFIITDVAVAWILFKLTEEHTSDRKKAFNASALWLFSLPVIYMSAVQAQFDTISALLLLLTVYLIYHDRTFIAGMVFTTSVLLKFFPAFCILVFIGYLYVRHRDDGQAVKKILMAVTGSCIMAMVLIMPQILDGTWSDALSFVTGRIDRNENPFEMVWKYLGMIVMVAGMIVCGIMMFKAKENINRKFIECTTLALIFSILTSLAPQYMIVFLPLLCMMIADDGRKYRKCWMLMTFGAFFAALSLNNMSLLLSLSEYTNMISPETVMNGMRFMESISVTGMTSVEMLNAIGVAIQMTGLILTILIYFQRSISDRSERIGLMIDRMSGFNGQN